MRGRLLTNVECKRRHLTVEDRCDIFRDGVEDVSHVLRRCVFARSAWDKLVKGERMVEFQSMSFRDWFITDIMGKGEFVVVGTDWSRLFKVVCWKLWSHRNHILFDREFIDKEEIVAASIQYAKMIQEAD
ncbi:hypothetical protein V6N13_013214 [Hibiscus sabdariffa]